MLNQRKQRKRAPQDTQRKISLPIMKARSSSELWARERFIRDWQLGHVRGSTLNLKDSGNRPRASNTLDIEPRFSLQRQQRAS